MLEDLRYLLDYINKYKDQAYLQTVSDFFDSSLLNKKQDLPHLGIQKAINHKIYYILLRFSYWSHSPIFRDSIIDFFIQEYGVSRDFIMEVLTPSFQVATDYFADYRTFCESDKEFIRYIFVECATQQNEGDLERNLGIGSYLISQIKMAVDVASAIHQSEATGPLMFLPHLDSMVSDILYEMQLECVENPFKIALFRLRYSLLSSDRLRPLIEGFHFLDKIFDFLLFLGSKCSISYVSSIKAIDKRFLKSPIDIQSDQVLEELVHCDLVYFVEGSSVHSEVRLTTKSQEMTAEAFITKVFAKGDLSPAHISQMCVPYQMALFGADSLSVESLHELILMCRPMVPQVLEIALKSLYKRSDLTSFARTLETLKIQEKSPFLKRITEIFEPLVMKNVVEVDQNHPIVAKFEQLFASQEGS